jgi:cyanophycinase
MSMSRVFVVFVSAVLGASLLCFVATVAIARKLENGATGTGYTYYTRGDTMSATPQTPALGLMLMGGGDWIDEAFVWFAAKAGHGHIVILRASGGDDLQQKFFDEIGGVASVQTLVFDSREPASDPVVLDIVRKADGIFIAGGDQSRYIRFWKGTPLNEVLDQHVRAGKPLGGTSAGLAILGGSSYGALDGGSITSKVALRRPLAPAVTIDGGFLHLPFLSNVITDSHFAKRDRLGRLLAFIAKIAHESGATDIIGIGVDENTALCIDAEGIGSLFTGSGGHAWLVKPQGKAEVTNANAPLSFHNVPVIGIGANSRLHAKGFTVDNPAFESIADVDKGRLSLRKP